MSDNTVKINYELAMAILDAIASEAIHKPYPCQGLQFDGSRDDSRLFFPAPILLKAKPKRLRFCCSIGTRYLKDGIDEDGDVYLYDVVFCAKEILRIHYRLYQHYVIYQGPMDVRQLDMARMDMVSMQFSGYYRAMFPILPSEIDAELSAIPDVVTVLETELGPFGMCPDWRALLFEAYRRRPDNRIWGTDIHVTGYGTILQALTSLRLRYEGAARPGLFLDGDPRDEETKRRIAEDGRFLPLLDVSPGAHRGVAWDKRLAAMAYYLSPDFIRFHKGMAAEEQRILEAYPKPTAVERFLRFMQLDAD